MKKYTPLFFKAAILYRAALAGIIILNGLSNNAFGVAKTSVATGPWSTAGTWTPAGAPAAGDVVTIAVGHTVSLTASTVAGIGNVTVNGTLLFSTAGAAGKVLNMAAGTTLQVNGTVDMAGQEGDITIGAGSFFTIGAGGTFIWLPFTNTAAGATIFTNTTESFNATSNLIIDTWYQLTAGTAPPLGSVVTGNFGNVTIRSTIIGATIYNWYQDNQFEAHQILGNLTIGGTGATQGGWITLDRTNAMTTTTIGGNVTMENINSRLYVHLGASSGTKTLNIGGNLTLNNNYWMVGIYGTAGVAANANLNLNVVGNFSNSNASFFYGIFSTSNAAGSSANGNFNMTANNITVSNTSVFNGIVTYTVYNIITGALTTLAASANGNATVTVNNTLTAIDGTFFLIRDGDGNATLNVTGSMLMPSTLTGADVRGIYNQVTWATGTNIGSSTINVGGNLDFDEGIFMVAYGIGSATDIVTLNITGNLDINFANTTDIFRPVGFGAFTNPPPTLCLSPFDMDVAGNMIISGVAGQFISSVGGGNETIDIIGSVTISGGANSFNIIPNSGILATNGHTVTTNIGQSLNITGGDTFLSGEIGTLTANIGDNLSITGSGTLSIKGADGTANVNVQDDYIQTSDTLLLHNNLADATANVVTLTINSDASASGVFSLTGGQFNFDNNPSSISTNVLVILSSNFVIGGTGVCTHACHLTSGTVFGQMTYAKAGTTVYTRTSNTNQMRQVKQTVSAGTTVDASASPNPVQVTTHADPTETVHNTLTIDGVLTLGTQQISGNAVAPLYYSQVTVNNGGRLRTQHPNGLYDGTATAAINGMISGSNRMDYYLFPNSIIEYYGVDTQILTGINVGIATTNDHKYGILEINFGGTPDAEWVYPTATPTTTTAVYVRTQLVLTAGELNLDNDHATATGGRMITIENNVTTGIIRTIGYIRSEVEDGTGIISWQMGAVGGAHIYPFGYNSTNYIPFTFAPTGAAGDVNIGTYHTNAANLPYPPGITHVNAASTGLDNSALTVDRFWTITPSGAGGANITYICTPVEATGIPNPRAQRWIPFGWELPLQGSQSTVAIGTQADGVTGLNTWWTLADITSPLPVSLIDFSAACDGKNKIGLRWSTASETNNDYFMIEKSMDGKNFESFANVDGAGNSTSLVNYGYTDMHPYKSVTYYRLKQVDFSGVSEHSKIISSEKCFEDNTLLSVWVENNQMHLLINNQSLSGYAARLFDMQGRVVRSKLFHLDNGIFEEVINVSGISRGVYSLSILNEDEILSSKLIIQ